jgi:hypothetical protein
MTGKADFSAQEWKAAFEGPLVIETLDRNATSEEVTDYRRFVRTLAEKVANAHREDGFGAADPQ